MTEKYQLNQNNINKQQKQNKNLLKFYWNR